MTGAINQAGISLVYSTKKLIFILEVKSSKASDPPRKPFAAVSAPRQDCFPCIFSPQKSSIHPGKIAIYPPCLGLQGGR